MENDCLKIKFLGPPKVSYGGQTVKFPTRKAMALFALLVVEQTSFPREQLQSIFWPESEPHLAQSALRNTLVRLKTGLSGLDQPLRIAGDRIGFNRPRRFQLDLDLVSEAAAEIQATKEMSTPCCSLLSEAIKFVRGPFLDAFSLPDSPEFNHWSMGQRALWERRTNHLFDQLSTLQRENGLILSAIETVNRWLTLDNLNESAYRRLMELYFLNGDRVNAIRTYQACRKVMHEELEVKPSSETEQTFNNIRLAANVPPSSANLRNPT